MAIGVVPWTSEEGMRGERAAPETDLAEIALGAEAPEARLRIVRGTATRERELGRLLPDRFERSLAKMPADVMLRLQRRTSFHRTIRLDAHDEATRLATGEVIRAARVKR